jgi:hypothetical protein
MELWILVGNERQNGKGIGKPNPNPDWPRRRTRDLPSIMRSPLVRQEFNVVKEV